MPLFLKPIFLDKVWGSDNLRQFGYQLPNNHIGECWGISAHPHGKSVIENGIFAGQTLDQVWNNHREIFGDFPSKDFPLMAKIVLLRHCLFMYIPTILMHMNTKKVNMENLNVGTSLKLMKVQRLL